MISCSSDKLAVENLVIEREGQVVAVVKAEMAITQEERRQGLMYREKLPDGEGMFFVFENDHILSFWMLNTSIPLSIAFITNNGSIIEIRELYPHDENSVFSSRPARYALEVPQGWFVRAGVKIGDRIRVEDIYLNKSR
ncbi:MAG: DUF192 domain-containing protein [Treponema sp.]|nr:DUF192 domain-containing protein [Treponema sp.]